MSNIKYTTFEKLFRWRDKDVEALDRWLILYIDVFGGNINTVLNHLDGREGMELWGVDTWFETVISLTFEEIMDALTKNLESQPYEDHEKEKISYYLVDLEDSFEPFIEGYESSFNNCLDEIGIEKRDKELIIKDIVTYFLEE